MLSSDEDQNQTANCKMVHPNRRELGGRGHKQKKRREEIIQINQQEGIKRKTHNKNGQKP